MLSSTSSFRLPRYAIQTSLWLALMLASYSILVIWHPWKRPIAEDQWSQNRITAEAYCYASTRKPAVLTGSSLSGSIEAENLANLAFAGRSALEGLILVEAQKQLPSVVFVEINILPEGEVKEEASIGSNWIKRMPALRFSNRPIIYTLSALSRFLPAPARYNRGEPAALIDPQKLRRRVELRREAYSKPPAPTTLENGVGALKKSILNLQSRGCQIVLVELPIEPELAELPLPTAIRNAIRESMPELTFLRPAPNPPLTFDGIHLVQERRNEIAALLAEHAKSLIQGRPDQSSR